MKKFLFGLAALPFLAGVSLAAQPVPLSDKQMDTVTAGFDFLETLVQNLGTVRVAIDLPVATATGCPVPGGCYLSITGTSFPAGVQSFQLNAAFGP
jgi:hypothetical protein